MSIVRPGVRHEAPSRAHGSSSHSRAEGPAWALSLGLAAMLAFAGCGGDEESSPADGGSLPDGTAQDGQAGDGEVDAGSDSGNQPDGRTIPEGGSPSTPNQITCGLEICTTPDQQCCANLADGGMVSCQEAGETCTGGKFACDEAADCPSGQVCCVTYNPLASTLVSTCTANCQGLTSRQLCRTHEECQNGSPCTVQGCFGLTVETCGGVPEELCQ